MYGPNVTIGTALRIAKEYGGSTERPFVTQEEENIRANDLVTYAKQLDTRERMADVGEALGQTWPVKMAKGIVSGVTAPGDVYQGRLDPTSDEAVQRAMELAGTVMGGGFGMAPVGSLGSSGSKTFLARNEHIPAFKNIKPTTDDVYDVLNATFPSGEVVGDKILPLKNVYGGKDMTLPQSAARVKDLQQQLSSPDSYFSRVIVDQDGNVIEGAHRVQALRELGAKDVPVTMLRDNFAGIDLGPITTAIYNAGPMKHDYQAPLIEYALDALKNTKSVEEAFKRYPVEPDKYHPHYRAVLEEINRQLNNRADGGSVVDKALMVVSRQGLPLPKPPKRQHGGRPRT